MEFFSVRDVEVVRESLRDLKIELCLTNDEVRVRALLNDLKIEFFSVWLVLRVKELVRAL